MNARRRKWRTLGVLLEISGSVEREVRRKFLKRI